jgi:hypothetical protein
MNFLLPPWHGNHLVQKVPKSRNSRCSWPPKVVSEACLGMFRHSKCL